MNGDPPRLTAGLAHPAVEADEAAFGSSAQPHRMVRAALGRGPAAHRRAGGR